MVTPSHRNIDALGESFLERQCPMPHQEVHEIAKTRAKGIRLMVVPIHRQVDALGESLMKQHCLKITLGTSSEKGASLSQRLSTKVVPKCISVDLDEEKMAKKASFGGGLMYTLNSINGRHSRSTLLFGLFKLEDLQGQLNVLLGTVPDPAIQLTLHCPDVLSEEA
ncbi:hypothetical protein AMTR_s00102p00077400 [Amborella trichopoda]|uniref:Uncharacterized protein n=1 Tax=Amborella trichopoda TaxID=13333 RepID=W1NYS8_AMBTC|nr:hypothetical protein AMTR_s00102p00077400 [Amborella trichopoda]